MAMVTIHRIDVIVSDPNVRGGTLSIAGTQITLTDLIASYLYRGLSAEELAVKFPMSLGQENAALANY